MGDLGTQYMIYNFSKNDNGYNITNDRILTLCIMRMQNIVYWVRVWVGMVYPNHTTDWRWLAGRFRKCCQLTNQWTAKIIIKANTTTKRGTRDHAYTIGTFA